ncbi:MULTISPECIES: hypothetical protein [Oceanobacillus]|uniref:Uncharacterized protein n=1 Tax=Oceanobacillus indicireducens TaxID=1004261 RepID=A0A917Y5M7_9BACI|nr:MULTISPECIES: hypothetical protein [Oceanobacillus]GGN66146.1 hypothetical protein GCM10007971_35750 [Oceanobacillus indicireducens]
MEHERKITIINEIEYWKQHKLLPEHYCDFLLALYTEGEEATTIEQQRKGTSFTKVVERFQIALLYLLLPFSFIVIYFTEFHVNLQLVILFLLLSYSVAVAIYYKNKRAVYFHSAFIISLFLGLLLSLSISNLWFIQPIAAALVIVCNFIFWIFAGYKLKSKYIAFIGALGVIFVFLYYFLWN